MDRVDVDRIVGSLNSIGTGDPEAAHGLADSLLLQARLGDALEQPCCTDDEVTCPRHLYGAG